MATKTYIHDVQYDGRDLTRRRAGIREQKRILQDTKRRIELYEAAVPGTVRYIGWFVDHGYRFQYEKEVSFDCPTPGREGVPHDDR